MPPFYGSKNGNFEKGVNFAVGGATALECSVLEERGISCPPKNKSLGVQLTNFKESLRSLCGSPSGSEDHHLHLLLFFSFSNRVMIIMIGL